MRARLADAFNARERKRPTCGGARPRARSQACAQHRERPHCRRTAYPHRLRSKAAARTLVDVADSAVTAAPPDAAIDYARTAKQEKELEKGTSGRERSPGLFTPPCM